MPAMKPCQLGAISAMFYIFGNIAIYSFLAAALETLHLLKPLAPSECRHLGAVFVLVTALHFAYTLATIALNLRDERHDNILALAQGRPDDVVPLVSDRAVWNVYHPVSLVGLAKVYLGFFLVAWYTIRDYCDRREIADTHRSFFALVCLAYVCHLAGFHPDAFRAAPGVLARAVCGTIVECVHWLRFPCFMFGDRIILPTCNLQFQLVVATRKIYAAITSVNYLQLADREFLSPIIFFGLWTCYSMSVIPFALLVLGTLAVFQTCICAPIHRYTLAARSATFRFLIEFATAYCQALDNGHKHHTRGLRASCCNFLNSLPFRAQELALRSIAIPTLWAAESTATALRYLAGRVDAFLTGLYACAYRTTLVASRYISVKLAHLASAAYEAKERHVEWGCEFEMAVRWATSFVWGRITAAVAAYLHRQYLAACKTAKACLAKTCSNFLALACRAGLAAHGLAITGLHLAFGAACAPFGWARAYVEKRWTHFTDYLEYCSAMRKYGKVERKAIDKAMRTGQYENSNGEVLQYMDGIAYAPVHYSSFAHCFPQIALEQAIAKTMPYVVFGDDGYLFWSSSIWCAVLVRLELEHGYRWRHDPSYEWYQSGDHTGIWQGRLGYWPPAGNWGEVKRRHCEGRL